VSALPVLPARRGSGIAAALGRAELGLLAAATAGLGAVAVVVLVKPSAFDLPSAFDSSTVLRFLAASALYAFGHVLRFIRLALIAYLPGVRLRRLLQVHLLTTGLGVVLPFKLSELVRIREVGVVVGSLRRGLLVVWIERTLDAVVLIALVTVAALTIDGALDLVAPLLVTLVAFVVLTLVALTVLPANLRALMLHITRRRTGERGVQAMRLLRAALTTLRPAPELVRGKLSTIAVLSVAIWAVEVAVVALAIPGVGAEVSQLSTAMLSLLSSISSGATALFAASEHRLLSALADFGEYPDVGIYRLTLTLPALVAGAVAGASYLMWFRARRDARGTA
jgi:hypothetical protein